MNVAPHIKSYASTNYLFRNLLDGRHTCAIEILVVLTSLNEEVILNILLHLFPRLNEMVVPPVNLVGSPCSRCI